MAKPDRSSDNNKAHVTRIKATDSPRAKKPAANRKQPAAAKDKTEATRLSDVTESTSKGRRRSPLRAIGGYFKGSWYELRQVRWPDRRTTWGMTGALLAFTGFFVLIIVLIDMGFQNLFNALIGS